MKINPITGHVVITLQEAHDDAWVKRHISDLEEFEKYFRRKRQFDHRSKEMADLWHHYKQLRRLIDAVYFGEQS